MLKRAAMAVVLIAAISGVCFFLGVYSRYGNFLEGSRRTTSETLLRQVQSLSQLVTVKYIVEKVVDVQDSKWYGDNQVLLVAQGVVKAGINLENLRPGDLQILGGEITLTLPPPAITDVYLDDRHTKVIERSTGLLRAFDKDLEQNTRAQAVDELRVLALDDEILKDARDRAKAQLTALFYQIGFTNVAVRTR